MPTTRDEWIERKRVRAWASPTYGRNLSDRRCPVCWLRLHRYAVEIGDLVHVCCDPTGEIAAKLRRESWEILDGGAGERDSDPASNNDPRRRR